MQGEGEICLQKAVRFGSKNGLKRAVFNGLVTCRESNTCRFAFEKGVSKGPRGRQVDLKRASFASQLGIFQKVNGHKLEFYI